MRSAVAAAILILAVTAPLAAEDVAKPAVPADPCQLLLVAKLDMEMDQTGRITVPVLLNGTTKRMMVDTGASDTLIAAATLKDLQLKPYEAGNGAYLQGFDGTISAHMVHIGEFGIGRMRGKNFNLFVMDEHFDSAGLLGADILVSYDLDFDFANARMGLFAPHQCPGKAVYWTQKAYGVVPFTVKENHIWVRVRLDGEEVNAILDTGAADTVMDLDRASADFDLDKDKLRRSRHYPFKTLTIGDVSINSPAIELVPDEDTALLGRSGGALHMIIGMGVLRRLHLYISYKEKMIYITPATQY
jgi:predicted aspartyl protease